MPKKSLLRDLVMSCHGHNVDHLLIPNNVYLIGRSPPETKGYDLIKVLEGYNPSRERDENKEKQGLSVSRLQGILRIDERGVTWFLQKSQTSKTYQIEKEEINIDEHLYQELPELMDDNHQILTGVKKQLFSGDILVFSKDIRFLYPMLYLTGIDTEHERTLENRYRTEDTGVFTVEKILKRI
ncbi:hypothetical protein J4218_06090 [Candidatus Pacearchaeota archaeon]|nr:hypothetical protein [Candidatus Pacearchaeota archaeon]